MQQYVGREGGVLTIATSQLADTCMAARFCPRRAPRRPHRLPPEDLELFGLIAKEVAEEAAPDPDADAALPAAAAHPLVENAVAPMPTAPLPFKTDAEYAAFAEDRRRSRTTTVVF